MAELSLSSRRRPSARTRARGRAGSTGPWLLTVASDSLLGASGQEMGQDHW